MNSIHAVMVQLVISGSNYAIFLIMARLLDQPEFLGFSTAVGLNMFAFALAEAGISYVAPKSIENRADNLGAQIAGAFITISIVFYVSALLFGYLVWNLLALDSLQLQWVICYAIYFSPVLIVPAWALNSSVDKTVTTVVFIARTMMIVAVWYFPSATTLLGLGIAAFALAMWVVMRVNMLRIVVNRPNYISIKIALNEIKHVFLARTTSYAAYSAMPLLVGIFRDNNSVALYITAERMKSLYAAIFQPIIQSFYFWRFRSEKSDMLKKRINLFIQLLNIGLCATIVVAGKFGWLNIFGERLVATVTSSVVWLAAAFSVSSACILYLYVFPCGKFALFRRATYFQLIGFALTGVWLINDTSQVSTWLLFGGELALLFAILMQIKLTATPQRG